MAQGDIETGGGVLKDNDVVPLTLACRTVAKAAAKLAMGAETNEAEIKVSQPANRPASLVRSCCRFLGWRFFDGDGLLALRGALGTALETALMPCVYRWTAVCIGAGRKSYLTLSRMPNIVAIPSHYVYQRYL